MHSFQDFLAVHDKIKEKSIHNRLLKHKDLVQVLNKYALGGHFSKKVIGKSVEGKSIHELRLGKGSKKIMMWSQMHGNEPTATAAICDFLNLLISDLPLSKWVREEILDKVSLSIIPMLNPDGAEEYSRYNALGVDLNRDARALCCPESQILKQAHDDFTPEIALNLHDQRRAHGVGATGKPATLSFLAPDAFPGSVQPNNQKSAMRMIAHLYKLVNLGDLNGQIGRYDDVFTPTAFGDAFQSWGAETILIESGGAYNDYERQVPRKYNFALLLEIFKQASTEDYNKLSTNDYAQIPENKEIMIDVIFRGISLKNAGFEYRVDLGINLEETERETTFHYKPYLSKIGDLQLFKGYQEIDGSSLEVHSKSHMNSESYVPFTIHERTSGQLKYDFSSTISDPVKLT